MYCMNVDATSVSTLSVVMATIFGIISAKRDLMQHYKIYSMRNRNIMLVLKCMAN